MSFPRPNGDIDIRRHEAQELVRGLREEMKARPIRSARARRKLRRERKSLCRRKDRIDCLRVENDNISDPAETRRGIATDLRWVPNVATLHKLPVPCVWCLVSSAALVASTGSRWLAGYSGALA